MELIIHDLTDGELKKLSNRIEGKEKFLTKITENVNQSGIIIDEKICVICNDNKIKKASFFMTVCF